MTKPLSTDLSALAELGTENLQAVIAIDSQSDERSAQIPSTEGQRALAQFVKERLGALGYTGSIDANANLTVEIPGTVDGPAVCLMVHIDTARGTRAVEKLHMVKGWDGSQVPFPENKELVVSATHYPETAVFKGEDLLFGPGQAAVGFDDKLGLAILLTLARVLRDEPALPRPRLVLAFRPDEEIGRHEAVQTLAATLAERGVKFGYTVDGIHPFEINVENFNAARATVTIAGRPLTVEPRALAREVKLRVTGVKSHGATARAEGYRNATVILTETLGPLSRRQDILPLSFTSDPLCEVDADAVFQIRGDSAKDLDRAERALVDAFAPAITPHAWRGARVAVTSRRDVDAGAPLDDAAMRTFAHIATFLRTDGPVPVLSEDSDGHEGYSNPCFLHRDEAGQRVEYRLRDFTRDGLERRIAHVQAAAALGPGPLPVVVQEQYVNMGPALAPHRELVTFAEAAARAVHVDAVVRPIRGGTGVDPFLERGIPVANLGTGYFAPESEKELTSRQSLARHVQWVTALVGEIAKSVHP